MGHLPWGTKALEGERASSEASVANPTHGEEGDVAKGQG